MITDEQVLVLSHTNEGFYINHEHVLVGDKVTYKPLKPEVTTQAKIVPRLVINHTNGGSTTATPDQLWNYASLITNVIEPHLDFGTDGAVLQFLPFNVRADCNAAANLFRVGAVSNYGAISHESQDSGYLHKPINEDPWSLFQLQAFVRVITAECATYGIRCTIPTHDKDSGVGYHAQFPSWSNSGHSCPGNARIRQMSYIWSEIANRLANFYGQTGLSCP